MFVTSSLYCTSFEYKWALLSRSSWSSSFYWHYWSHLCRPYDTLKADLIPKHAWDILLHHLLNIMLGVLLFCSTHYIEWSYSPSCIRHWIMIDWSSRFSGANILVDHEILQTCIPQMCTYLTISHVLCPDNSIILLFSEDDESHNMAKDVMMLFFGWFAWY